MTVLQCSSGELVKIKSAVQGGLINFETRSLSPIAVIAAESIWRSPLAPFVIGLAAAVATACLVMVRRLKRSRKRHTGS